MSVSNKPIKNDDVLLFPNPSGIGSVFIALPYILSNEVSIEMTDLTGKIIRRQLNQNLNQNIFELNYGDLPQGIYLINIKAGHINQTKKIVVE